MTASLRLGLLTFCGIFLASFALQAQHVLNFTELSANNFTAALDGNPVGTVTELSPDHWTFTIDGFVVLPSSPGLPATWMEPPTEAGFNLLSPTGTGLLLQSDFPIPMGPILPNGTPDPGLLLLLNLTNQQVTTSFVIFTDVTDKSSMVPDSPSTLGLGLLAISIAALLGLRRLRLVRSC
jgi:hypothetical protein